jgi:arylsulfatase A-like enzyme
LLTGQVKLKQGKFPINITAGWNFFPTLSQIAAAPFPDSVDGISFYPTLFGDRQAEHSFLYWENYNYNYNWNNPITTCPGTGWKARQCEYGKWKAVKNNIYKDKNSPIELYDLEKDDLIAKNSW